MLPSFLLVEAFLLSADLSHRPRSNSALGGARAMGAYVWRVSLGFGPLRRRLRIADAQVELHRHLFAGSGSVQAIALGGGRLRALVYISAGALRTRCCCKLLAGYALGDGFLSYVGTPILAGLGLSQAVGLLNLLSFQSRDQNLPSDGRRILACCGQRPPGAGCDPTRSWEGTPSLMAERRFRAARGRFRG